MRLLLRVCIDTRTWVPTEPEVQLSLWITKPRSSLLILFAGILYRFGSSNRERIISSACMMYGGVRSGVVKA